MTRETLPLHRSRTSCRAPGEQGAAGDRATREAPVTRDRGEARRDAGRHPGLVGRRGGAPASHGMQRRWRQRPQPGADGKSSCNRGRTVFQIPSAPWVPSNRWISRVRSGSDVVRRRRDGIVFLGPFDRRGSWVGHAGRTDGAAAAVGLELLIGRNWSTAHRRSGWRRVAASAGLAWRRFSLPAAEAPPRGSPVSCVCLRTTGGDCSAVAAHPGAAGPPPSTASRKTNIPHPPPRPHQGCTASECLMKRRIRRRAGRRRPAASRYSPL